MTWLILTKIPELVQRGNCSTIHLVTRMFSKRGCHYHPALSSNRQFVRNAVDVLSKYHWIQHLPYASSSHHQNYVHILEILPCLLWHDDRRMDEGWEALAAWHSLRRSLLSLCAQAVFNQVSIDKNTAPVLSNWSCGYSFINAPLDDESPFPLGSLRQ